MSDPTVSVIVPTYNREALLPRALDSIIAQTFDDWEIILVNDGSTDGTETIAHDYARCLGRRFQYIYQDNAGCGAARNRGIDAARGRFVAALDSDDEFLPRKLERQLGLFTLRPDLGLVFSDMTFIDLHGTRHLSHFDSGPAVLRQVPTEYLGDGYHVCGPELFDYLLRRYLIPTIVGMVRREVLGDSIRWLLGQTYAEEWLFFLQVVRVCRAGFVDEPLSLHHFVTSSLSRTDSHRNMVRLRMLLHAMKGAFPGLGRGQRRIIRSHLARACHQLGFEDYRAGRYRQAVRYFAESFVNRPGLGTLTNVADAATHSVLSRGGVRRSEPIVAQDEPDPVR